MIFFGLLLFLGVLVALAVVARVVLLRGGRRWGNPDSYRGDGL